MKLSGPSFKENENENKNIKKQTATTTKKSNKIMTTISKSRQQL